ncbi:hypothetical protein EVAR_51682_1 [Eumeta japonica]|uniref:Uncharacterized protein n=1 Tax=Eumeta variegata TaxID=151549 RepID=A0A4C1Y715_EUMVA|nr:hypothetical protein EVAR_51682_1 [Eumeta japonica]
MRTDHKKIFFHLPRSSSPRNRLCNSADASGHNVKLRGKGREARRHIGKRRRGTIAARPDELEFCSAHGSHYGHSSPLPSYRLNVIHIEIGLDLFLEIGFRLQLATRTDIKLDLISVDVKIKIGIELISRSETELELHLVSR